MLNEPVVGERFYGRREVLHLLNKRVNALKEGYRQNVALTGQNLSGKSSILHHFLYNFYDNRILPIYVEVTDEPLAYFCQRFIGSLLYNYLRMRGAEPKEDFRALIEEARPHLPQTVRSINQIQDHIKKKERDEAYSMLFDLTSTVKEEIGKSCVIILDEFHNLASLDVKGPFKAFGKKIMVQKDTMYIVTSSQVATVKRILNEKLSLLFGNFEIVQVDGFPTKSALSFLDKNFKFMRVPSEFKDFIIALTEGNPFYLDVISESIKDVVSGMTFKRVTHDVLTKALVKSVFNSKGCIAQYLNNCLERIRQSKNSELYISMLLAVADGSYRLKDISKAVRKRVGDTTKYANDLVEMNVLFKNGTIYRFVDKMFGFWLKHVYQKRRSAIISYLPDRIEIFRDEIKAYIDSFLAEEKVDIVDRAAALFGLFNNETVVISDREYKLPPFSSVAVTSFDGSRPYILSKTKGGHWVLGASPTELKDIDVIDFIERCRSLKLKIRNKILLAASGAEMNARLLAKEEKVWIWDLKTFNQLLSLYGKERVVNIVYNEKEST